MMPSYSGRGFGNFSAREARTGTKFKSVRRIFRMMELISRRGEAVTAKQLANEIGTNLASCY